MSASKPALAPYPTGFSDLPPRPHPGTGAPPKAKRRWSLPSPGKALLRLLQEQVSLAVTGVELLQATATVQDFEELQFRSRKLGLQINAKLNRNLLTPLDAEDIRTLASQNLRLLRLQANVGVETGSKPAGWAGNPQWELLRLADSCSRLLAAAVEDLTGRDTVHHTVEIRRCVKAARQLLRNWTSELLGASEASLVLSAAQFRAAHLALFGQYFHTARTLTRIRFKNG